MSEEMEHSLQEIKEKTSLILKILNGMSTNEANIVLERCRETVIANSQFHINTL